MTNEQAIAHFKEQLEVFGGEHHEAMKVAIEALEKQNSCKDCAGCTQWLCECANVRAEVCDKIIEQLEKLRQEYPYKVVGEYDTYSTYNEAWSDCSDRAIAIVKGVQNE